MRSGILAMLLSVSAGTFSDALMRATSNLVPPSEILVIRGSAMACVAGLACIFLLPRSTWSRLLRGGAIARSIVDGIAILFFFLALPMLPLGDLIAISLSSPIIATALSLSLGREKVVLRSWVILLIGFCGVALIVRPTMASIDQGAIFALLSAIALAVRDLATRSLDSAIPSIAVVFSSAVAVLAFGGSYAVFDKEWVGVTLPALFSLFGSIALLVVNGALGVIAFRLADVATVSPIRYVSLPIAMAMSFVMFGDVPDLPGISGGMLIVGCGIAIALRSRKERPAEAQSAG